MIPKRLRPIFHKFRKYYLPLVVREPESDDELKELFSLLRPDDVVVEIGANIGGTTVKIARICKFVYAFEPQRQAFEILQAYVKGFNNVQVFNKAIDAENMRSQISRRPETNLSSRSASLYLKTTNSEYVDVCTLDSMLKEFKHTPTVLVMDCEGSEVNAIRGAENALKKIDVVVCETHEYKETGFDTFPSIFETLQKRGLSLQVFEHETRSGNFKIVVGSSR